MDVIFRCFDGTTAEQINDAINSFCEQNEMVELSRSDPVVVLRDEFNQFMVRSEFRPMNWYEIKKLKERNYTPLEKLDLSLRAANVFKYNGIKYIEEIAAMDRERLLDYRNMGKKTLDEVIEKLERFGYRIQE